MALRASTASVGGADWLVSVVHIYHTRELPNSCVTHNGAAGSAQFLLGQIILLCCVALALMTARV